jgi:type IV pilus secretin PilQ/predicted competence protein
MKGSALVLAVVLAGGLATASSPEPGSGATTTPSVRLKTISARVTNKGTSLVIEASEPVPYVATRPDALTLLIDFRNVAADSVVNSIAADVRSAIASVAVEQVADEATGAESPRIRVMLSEPVAHRARASRNTVVIDFDKSENSEKAKSKTPYVMPPASRAPAPSAPTADVLLARLDSTAVDPIAALGLDASGASRGRADANSSRLFAQQAGQGPVGAALPQAPPVIQDAPAQNPNPQGLPGVARAGERRFTGNPVSLDFQGADLRAVLRTFSEISGLNIVIDPAVSGSVDVALRDVPWDQALDIILRANKLGYLVDGTIVRIAPLTVLSEEESQRRKLTDEQALAGELRVLTKTLSYAKAEELTPLLTKSALSQRGTVNFDVRTNTLIITDLPDRLTTATDLINTLDRAQPQVEIEARIVQVNKNYTRNLGVQWGFNGRVDPALGNTTNLAFPNSVGVGGQAGTPGQVPSGTAVNLGLGSAATSAVGLVLGSVNGAFNLDVALSAVESSGNGRLLATPRVSTQNNIEAEIKQGTKIPIQTSANNTVTTTFVDATLTLKVTPQITASNTVILKIAIENNSADFGKQVLGIPSMNTQAANTSVLVNDGQTTVIGGIYSSKEAYSTDKTPGLGSIPLIKWLFKRETALDESQELLIFLTPRITKN